MVLIAAIVALAKSVTAEVSLQRFTDNGIELVKYGESWGEPPNIQELVAASPLKASTSQTDCQRCVRGLDKCGVGRGNCDNGWYCVQCLNG
ncbi:hypothetical protein EJ08DRAFT_701470 [Tothia fuscella]|uniref:Uncharacterized protein n=1 Tax=Tothia fuscella TaxID=1048955 RepID=A0A9P4NIL8_9PEZI|nr:hypothetical protein EJ08DRAFT_701470 [Tothia fuscella]